MRVSAWALSGDENPRPGAGAEPRNVLLGAIDIRTKPVESSEAGILSALRDAPSVVGTVLI